MAKYTLSSQLDMIKATLPPNFAGHGHQSKDAIREMGQEVHAVLVGFS